MKKTLMMLVLASITVIIASAQQKSQRLVLAEEFTNASCPPCASQNPAFQALLNANPDKITALVYHTNWPGTDPMNAHNPQDVGARVSYYGVTGVPNARIDGVAPTGSSYSGAPANLTQAKIDQAYAVPSPLEIQIQHIISPANDSVYLVMLVKATQAITGMNVAHLAVIEKEITFTSPPGSNGEKSFPHVMKKMLPNKNGTSLSGGMDVGDYVIIQTQWAFANVYKPSEIAAVGFVQNNTSKAVLQAANSSTSPVTPPYVTDATIASISNVPINSCSNSLTPLVTIQNNGSATLTEVDIEYSVNGGTSQTIHWTGSLAFLQRAIVQLPTISYTLQPSNTLLVKVLNPNAIPDEYTKNDSRTATFAEAPTCRRKLHLNMKTDNYPQQTTWQVLDSQSSIMASGGPYSTPNTVIELDIALPADGCYRFIINDAGNNGICCSTGYGYYQLTDSTGTVIAEGDQFGAQAIHAFYASANVGIEEQEVFGGLSVFPNPIDDRIGMSFFLPGGGTVILELFNGLGDKILSRELSDLTSGRNTVEVRVPGLAEGMYVLRLTAGDAVVSAKITR